MVFSPAFAQSANTSVNVNETTAQLIRVLTQLLQQLELQLQTLLAQQGSNSTNNLTTYPSSYFNVPASMSSPGGTCASGQIRSNLNGGCIIQSQDQTSITVDTSKISNIYLDSSNDISFPVRFNNFTNIGNYTLIVNLETKDGYTCTIQSMSGLSNVREALFGFTFDKSRLSTGTYNCLNGSVLQLPAKVKVFVGAIQGLFTVSPTLGMSYNYYGEGDNFITINSSSQIIQQPQINISWSNGTGNVQLGLVDSSYESNGNILGWISLKNDSNGSIVWNGQSVTDLTGNITWSVPSLSQGPFRIIAVTTGSSGNNNGVGGDTNFLHVLSNNFNISNSVLNIGLPSFASLIQNQFPVINSINGKGGFFTAGNSNTAYGQNLTDVQSVELSPVGGNQGVYVEWANAAGNSVNIDLPSNPGLPTGSYNLFITNRGGTSKPFKVDVVR